MHSVAWADAAIEDFIIGHAPIHPVVKVGTPQGSDITATKRHSIVPSVGDSPGSVSTLGMEEFNLLNNSSNSNNNSSRALYHSSSSNRLAANLGESPERRPSQASSGLFRRDSTAVSFIDDFPSPPHLSQPTFESTSLAMPSSGKQQPHATAFGQLVTGPPGAGKTTYCHGMHQVSPPVPVGSRILFSKAARTVSYRSRTSSPHRQPRSSRNGPPLPLRHLHHFPHYTRSSHGRVWARTEWRNAVLHRIPRSEFRLAGGTTG